MAAVLRRPRALDQLDAILEAIEIEEARSSADAVGSGRLPGTRRCRYGAVGSAGEVTPSPPDDRAGLQLRQRLAMLSGSGRPV
jgi:hypothetical protein